jgi:hypothetical protein
LAKRKKNKQRGQLLVNGFNLGEAERDPETGTIEAGPHIVINFKHCDDYIDDETAPESLRKYLARARLPAHGMLVKEPFPELYADYEGKRVRVVMASTFGDVGITHDLSADLGYETRVPVEKLSNFSDKPR